MDGLRHSRIRPASARCSRAERPDQQVRAARGQSRRAEGHHSWLSVTEYYCREGTLRRPSVVISLQILARKSLIWEQWNLQRELSKFTKSLVKLASIEPFCQRGCLGGLFK